MVETSSFIARRCLRLRCCYQLVFETCRGSGFFGLSFAQSFSTTVADVQ